MELYEQQKEKGKKVLFNVIYGRTVVMVIFFILQVLILFEVFWLLNESVVGLTGFQTLISVIILVIIVNQEETGEFKLAWIVPICILPIFGSLFYIFIKLNFGYIKLKKEVTKIETDTKHLLETKKDIKDNLRAEDSHISGFAKYMEKTGGYPVYQNTEVEYFPLGEDKFKAMLVELEKAEKFIFMEYFIIKNGLMWNSILKILEKKAKEGVEVRVMYDGTCSLVNLPYSYPEILKEMGINAKMFSPIRPLLSTHQNNRDHRKILVIDGKVAFNGGINLGDEYINEVEVHGHWKDNAVLLRGEAVDSFTLMFLQLWNIGEKEQDDFKQYFGKYDIEKSNSYIIPYGDGPTNDIDIAKNVYMDIINTSKDYVYIMTPYLILDYDFVEALLYASDRGVDIRIIIPHIPDKPIPFDIAHTHIPKLVTGGVRVYEYTPGFIHAKTFVSDDKKAVVGTINLDYRSLYLHYECATFIYDDPVVDEIKKDYFVTLDKCKEFMLEDYVALNAFKRMRGRIFRVFGPLL